MTSDPSSRRGRAAAVVPVRRPRSRGGSDRLAVGSGRCLRGGRDRGGRARPAHMDLRRRPANDAQPRDRSVDQVVAGCSRHVPGRKPSPGTAPATTRAARQMAATAGRIRAMPRRPRTEPAGGVPRRRDRALRSADGGDVPKASALRERERSGAATTWATRSGAADAVAPGSRTGRGELPAGP